MKENFPNLVKEIDMQVQEAQRFPNNILQKDNQPNSMVWQNNRHTSETELRAQE